MSPDHLRDPETEYQVARAVWLYARLQRLLTTASPTGDGPRIGALCRRIQRWLVHAPEPQRRAYYQRICIDRAGAKTDAQKEARAEISRQRGRRVLAGIPAEEFAVQFAREPDEEEVADAEGVE
jgi:hypothetical protein